jgi:MFS family permease
MDLFCTSEKAMGFIGSSFFIGCFVGSFILPRASDIYGRKPLFIIGLIIYVAVVVSSLFCSNLNFMYFILFMGGISETGRYYVAYVYAVEFMPKHFKDKTGLYIFVCFGVCMVLIAIRFWAISERVWTWNAYLAIVLAITSMVGTIVWLPESPNFLYSRKRF